MNKHENMCSVGQCLDEKCYNNVENSSTLEFTVINSLSAEDIKLLCLRLPNIGNVNKTICQQHIDRFLKYYSAREYKCDDPWSKHSKNVITNLRVVDLEIAEHLKQACSISVKPGKKVCTNCLKDIMKTVKDYKEQLEYCVDPFDRHRIRISNNLTTFDEQSLLYLKTILNKQYSSMHNICSACRVQLESSILECKKTTEMHVAQDSPNKSDSQSHSTESDTPGVTQSTSGSEYQSNSQNKRILDGYLEVFDMPPFKRQKLSDNSTIIKGIDIVQNIVDKVCDTFQESNNVELPRNLRELKIMDEKSLAFDKIILNLQKKYKISRYNEKLSIIALLPDDWKLSKVQEHFGCTRYMFEEARKLQQQGPKFERTRRKYFQVSSEVRKEIIAFYLDDNNSVVCSGIREQKKIYLDDGTTIRVPKRILLYDLKILYNDWIKQTKQTKIPCFAFFCQMKPDECVFAGDPGTHNICVCDKHQNLKLKLSACEISVDYREVIAVGVCSINDQNCMLKDCDQCPGKEVIREFLKSNIDIDETARIKYSNWTNVSITNANSESSSHTRMTMQDFEVPFSEFVENLIEDIWLIRRHHFIAAEQKKYYSECKKNLDKDTGIIVMDFAENYSFICQDSTQGFYFNNAQASLFTASIYDRNQITNVTDIASFCVISDSTKHQAYSVHIFQEAIIEKIKVEYPWIKKLIYFSDGAPTQFKNKNNFINACHHEEDFGIEIVSHNFFATSHGKSACDGIGATAKVAARKASLQKVKILDAKEMFNYLSEKQSSIRFCFVDAKDVEVREKKLKKRFKSAKTIRNTRDSHRFEPLNKNQMIVRQFSTDPNVKVVSVT